MQHDSSRFSTQDAQYVSEKLGRAPLGVIGVAHRDHAGRPAVIINHPLIAHGERYLPFPTVYWLVDPSLSHQLSDLERRGAIGTIERAIADDAALMRSLHEDHRGYAARRWALLTPVEQRYAIDHGLAETLRDKGIGGVANFDTLKCLHLNAAHHLALLSRGGTTPGRLLAAMYGVSFEL